MALTPYSGSKPQRNVRATFSTYMDAWLTWFLDTFMAEIDTVVDAMNLNDVSDTSTTSNSINMTAGKSFIVSSGKGFLKGGYLNISDNAAPTTNAMVVQVVSYSGTTLVVDPVSFKGGGTKNDWVISFSAPIIDIGSHRVIARGGSGYGSTRTMRRVFTTIEESTGTAVTYTNTAANGLEITVNEDGLYKFIYRDESGNSAQPFGIVVDNTEYTTGINSVTVTDIKSFSYSPAANVPVQQTLTIRLASGSVVAPHTAGTATPGTSDRRVYFSAEKAGN